MSKPESNLESPSITSMTQETDSLQQTPKNSQIMSAISMTLIQLISDNHSKANYKEKIKAQAKQIFTSRSLPKISISDYIHRIMKYTKIEETTLILALIYIDRLCRKKKILLTEYNVHRILFVSVLAALKYNEDKFYSNVYYAKIGGLEIKQLNTLEIEFVIGINFDLFVDNKIFEKYESTLIRSSQI